MSEEVEKLIEQRLEEFIERQRIRCPHCKGVQENDDGQYPVSYHGEDPPEEWECDNCEKTFIVKEEVTREYIVAKTREELGKL